jgi:hypothetical protein
MLRQLWASVRSQRRNMRFIRLHRYSERLMVPSVIASLRSDLNLIVQAHPDDHS